MLKLQAIYEDKCMKKVCIRPSLSIEDFGTKLLVFYFMPSLPIILGNFNVKQTNYLQTKNHNPLVCHEIDLEDCD